MTTPRRVVVLLAVLCLAAVACGGGDDDEAGPGPAGGDGDAGPGAPDLPECPVDALEDVEGPVEVVVWHTLVAKPLETMETLVEEYNASQDRVVVRLESQGNSYTELQRKFEAAIASDGLPEIVVFDDTATQVMADSGVILPAQSCLDASGATTEDLHPVAVDYYTIDGVLWPGSANLGSILMYYNADHFTEAGLDPDDPPTTLEELRAAAEAIKEAGVADTPLVHELASWKTEFWLTGAGSAIVDNENGRGGGLTTAGNFVDNPEVLELFGWLADMEADGLLLPVPRSEGAIDHYLAMGEENASILIESSSAATSVEAFLAGDLDTGTLGVDVDPSEASGLNIVAAALPTMVEGAGTQMGGGAWYLTDTGSDEAKAAAWDFLTFLNTPASQAAMLIDGSALPYVPAANDLPEVQDFYQTGLSGPWLAIANEAVAAIDPSFPGPLIGPYYDVRLAIEDAQDDLLLRGETVEAVVADLQAAVDEAIAAYNEGDFG